MSRLDEPFSKEERERLAEYPNCNELLMELAPAAYTKETIRKDDYRLVKVVGKRVIIHDRAYRGKGVKKMDLTLNDEGMEILRKWQAKIKR